MIKKMYFYATVKGGFVHWFFQHPEDLAIGFNSYLHRALYSLNKRNSLREETKLKLQSGSLMGVGAITDKGKQVLEELKQRGPKSKDIAAMYLTITVNKFLINYTEIPAYAIGIEEEYLLANDYLQLHYPFRTDKGEELLTKYSLKLLTGKRLTYNLRPWVVQYLSLEQLPSFLAHEDSRIREAAKSRYYMLTGKHILERR